MNIKLKDMDAVKFNGIDIGAVKFNGEYVWRKGSVVVLRHNAGTFSAFANGAGIKWRYKDNEVMTKSCNFKIDESDNNVYLLFDKELSKFTCNRDNNLLLDLSDLQGKITNTLSLANCSNITGIYYGTSYPRIVNLSNTGISPTDMDTNLINFNNSGKKNGAFTASGMSRTSASDTAVEELTARGWKITGLTKVERTVI